MIWPRWHGVVNQRTSTNLSSAATWKKALAASATQVPPRMAESMFSARQQPPSWRRAVPASKSSVESHPTPSLPQPLDHQVQFNYVAFFQFHTTSFE